MMTGKAIMQALHGHYLVDASLMEKLISKVLPPETGSVECNTDDMPTAQPPSNDDCTLDETQVAAIQGLLSRVMDRSIPVEDIVNSKELIALDAWINCKKMTLQTHPRTCKLWLQYLD